MIALKANVLILVVLCGQHTASLLENLIEDGSFEERVTKSWNMTERISNWSTTTRQRLRVDCVNRHSGRCSAVFDVFNNIQAKFMSQYVNVVEKLGVASAGAIRFEFWYSGFYSSKVRVQLDIVYADQHRRMSVGFSPAEREDYLGADMLRIWYLDEVFTKSCTVVPNYGPIRAIMLHFALDHKLVTDEFIYIDDVDLRIVAADEAIPEDCSLYQTTFPTSRQMIIDYLHPLNDQLRSRSELGVLNGITLATQLRVDQFGALERAVAEWNGPVSTAVMVFVDPEHDDIDATLREITEAYSLSVLVSSFVTVHVVVEDRANRAARPDSANYPANFMRNVAIANVHTSHVFYVDVADTFPAFNERQALRWLEDAGEISQNVPPRAYVVPTFQSKSRNKHMDDFPRNKLELLDEIRDANSRIEPHVGENLQSAAVKYRHWMTTGEPYAIKYVDDMDLSFIIRTSSSPVISDLYVGYGKDRSAYSRDVAAAGFQFVILPYAFLFHFPEARPHEDVRLDVFLNAAFHIMDLKAGFFHLPSFYQHTREKPGSDESLQLDDDDILKREREYLSEEINVLYLFDELLTVNLEEGTTVIEVHEQRLDTVVESLMEALGVTTFVELTSDDVGLGFSFFLGRTLLEAAIIIHQFADVDTQFVHDQVVWEYKTRGGIDSMNATLRRIVDHFPGPKIFSFDFDSSMMPLNLANMYIRSMLSVATDLDVILLSNHSQLNPFEWMPFNNTELLTKLHPIMEQSKPGWEMYRYAQSVVLKSTQLVAPPALHVPRLPVCRPSNVISPIVVDVVFISQNRPMQTLAFLEGLLLYVEGVRKVWVIYKSDYTEVSEAYDKVMRCISPAHLGLDVQFIDQGKDLGQTYTNVLEGHSDATYVLLASDGVMWLSKVDLRFAVKDARLNCHDQQNNGAEIFALNLRLGRNLLQYLVMDEHVRVQCLSPLSRQRWDDPDLISALYPHRLTLADFAVLLHLRGLVARRADVVADLRGLINGCQSHGCIESRWVAARMKNRSRQWQAMFGATKVSTRSLSQSPVTLARMFTEDRLKIDVQDFADSHQLYAESHEWGYGVKYIDTAPC